MLIVLGFITMLLGIVTVIDGVLITKPETGIAREVFIGVAVGVAGLVMIILGRYVKHWDRYIT